MNMKRMRGRNHRPGGNGGGGGGSGGAPIRHHSGGGVPLNRNHVFDSNGPDIRIRGTAQQLFEKYLQLGRDATSSGDRVTAEAFFQHAEHYFRILNAMNQAQQQGQPNGQAPQQQHPQSNQRRNYQQGDGYQGEDGQGQGDSEDGDQQRPDPRPSEPRASDPRASDPRAPGLGDQPEAREIPITAAPPEG
jgi:uncharacterized protein DUF4167